MRQRHQLVRESGVERDVGLSWRSHDGVSENDAMTGPGSQQGRGQQTRRVLRRAAMVLFLERGYDNVTTVDIAQAAGVSPATLFNHFKTKEDLFFGQVEQLERELIAVVAGCSPNDSLLTALQEHVLHDITAGRAANDPGAVATFHRQVQLSADLQTREFAILQRREVVLIQALRDAGHEEIPARVAAAMVITAERLIATELRVRLAKGSSPKRVLVQLRPFIAQVFDMIRAGIGELPALG
jgi:AcrR family transcriptional regulator